MELDGGLMHLIPENRRVESGLRSAEGAPPGHHAINRRVGPETEVESPALLVSPTGDSRDDSESLAPARDSESRDSTAKRFLA